MAFSHLSRIISGKLSRPRLSPQPNTFIEPEWKRVQEALHIEESRMIDCHTKQRLSGGAMAPKRRFRKYVKAALNKSKKRLTALFYSKLNRCSRISAKRGGNETYDYSSFKAMVKRRTSEFINTTRRKVRSLTGDGKIRRKPNALQKEIPYSTAGESRRRQQGTESFEDYARFLTDLSNYEFDIDPYWHMYQQGGFMDEIEEYGLSNSYFDNSPEIYESGDGDSSIDRALDDFPQDTYADLWLPFGTLSSSDGNINGLALDNMDDDGPIHLYFHAIDWDRDAVPEGHVFLEDILPGIAFMDLHAPSPNY